MPGSTNEAGTNEEECDMTYDPSIENAKYLIQLLYMAPGVLLNLRILIVLFHHRKIYMAQSFFVIYSLDLIVIQDASLKQVFLLAAREGQVIDVIMRRRQGPCEYRESWIGKEEQKAPVFRYEDQNVYSSTQLIIDLFIQRATTYIPQFCPLLFGVFKAHVFFTNIYYTIYHYMRAAKPIIQLFLCLNRMTCVLVPFEYAQIWLRFIPIAIGVIVLGPFLVIWNVILSDTYPITIFGGFTLSYTRRVSWAKLSLFHIAIMMFSLAIIIPTTSITLFKMRALEIRLKSSERALCLASVCMSFGFFIAAAFQSYFAFFNTNVALEDLFYFLQAFSFDLLNVGSPIVMILLSAQLRYHVFSCRRLALQCSTIGSVSAVSRKI